MKIEPVYVTFEQAKLLFEKGFPGATEDDAVYTIHDKTRVYPLKYIKEGLFYHAPEQHIVVEWLRVNHGIWVWVKPYKDHASDNNDPIQHQMNVYKNGVTVSKEFDSHEEAYSAAFDYVLKELI